MRNLVFFLLLFTHLAVAQQPQFTVFDTENGLRQSQVYAICDDHLGYLWVGTQGGGVGRFDGAQFVHYTVADGLPSNFVYAVLEDSQHRIWIGTSRGVCFFDGVSIKTCPTDIQVNALVETDDHRLLLGTQKGIWTYNWDKNVCEKSTFHPNLDAYPVYALLPPYEGQIWVAAHRGAWQYDQKKRITDICAQLKLPQNPALALARQGHSVWFSSQGKGIINVSGLARPVYLPQLSQITALAVDGSGRLWAGTPDNGLYQIAQDTIVQHFTENNKLPHNHIRALFTDRNNRVWIGTSGGGFAYQSVLPFRSYGRDDGLPGTRIYALCEDRIGRIWMAVSQQGLAVKDSLGLHAASPDSGYLQGVKCRTIAEDRNGTLWVGTEGKGVLAITATGLKTYRRDNNYLPSDWVQKIVCSPNGDIWIGTSEGLVQFVPQDNTEYSTRRFGTREGMPGSQVSALQFDGQGNLWFGTYSGLVGYLKNGKVEAIFGQEQGLSGTIAAFAFDHENRCFVATKGNGIFWGMGERGNPFKVLTYTQKQATGNVYLLSFDPLGYLWAGTENGVDRLKLAGTQVIDAVHFGKSEGFMGLETCQDAFLADRAGGLWFGTMSGAMCYTPVKDIQQNSAPILHFEQAKVFYKPLGEKEVGQLFDGSLDGLVLPWHQNHLSFSFKGVILEKDRTVLYRWKLQDADNDWSPWDTQTQVNYASLAPGQYKLLIQASSDEITVSNTITAHFTIRKPFWKEWPFLLTITGILAGLIALGVRAYIRRVRRSEAERRSQLEVQNHILQLEQKALQLQMNPHFIFNALNSIQSLIATQNYGTARQEINHFAKLMRSILHNSRQSSISLREEMDTLEQYLKIEQSCQTNPFTYSITNNCATEMENIDIPPMLLQPFVENAVVHGIAPLQTPGHIAVHFDMDGAFLTCTVRDNGIGREKAAALKLAKQPGHQSAAMQVTKERLETMGGSVVFRDVAAGGTEVVVVVAVAF